MCVLKCNIKSEGFWSRIKTTSMTLPQMNFSFLGNTVNLFCSPLMLFQSLWPISGLEIDLFFLHICVKCVMRVKSQKVNMSFFLFCVESQGSDCCSMLMLVSEALCSEHVDFWSRKLSMCYFYYQFSICKHTEALWGGDSCKCFYEEQIISDESNPFCDRVTDPVVKRKAIDRRSLFQSGF